MPNLSKFIHFFLPKQKKRLSGPVAEVSVSPKSFVDVVVNLHESSQAYYDKDDLVYISEINSYAAFKYPVVKNILNNTDDIGISSLHLELNNIYFKKDEKRHQYHKKTAVNHLDFLSKKLQYADNAYTKKLFDYLLSHFPQNETFDLGERLINPLVFISVLNEFGFLETFPEFDPGHENFSLEVTKKKIAEFLFEKEKLFIYFHVYLESGGQLPSKMQTFINELDTHGDIDKKDLPNFFASMIFSALESTISFISSFIFVLFTKYPELLLSNEEQNKLHSIANEVLRIHTPIPFVYRNIAHDYSYMGANLRKGDLIILFLGSANMDEKYFDEPQILKEDRKEKHLAFGRGQYACIGQFASFRIAMNMVSYLKPFNQKLVFLDKQAKHTLHNSVLKLKMDVLFHG